MPFIIFITLLFNDEHLDVSIVGLSSGDFFMI